MCCCPSRHASDASCVLHSISLVEILLAIHERGIQHNDFCPRNIVVDNVQDPQRLSIIDFEFAKDHQCQRRYQVALYDLPPNMADFNCDEVYHAAELTEVWTPSESLSFVQVF